MGYVIWITTIVVQGVIAIGLTRSCGLATGFAINFLLIALMIGVAGGLLGGAEVGRVTWRNRLAGWLMPWTTFVGGGQLASLLIKNGLAACVFAGLVIFCDRMDWFMGPSAATPQSVSNLQNWVRWPVAVLTWICWLVLLVAWLWLIRPLLQGKLDTVSVLLNRGGSRWPLLMPPLVIAASVLLSANGYYGWALLVAAIPLVAILLPVLLMLGAIAWHSLQGKPIRWN